MESKKIGIFLLAIVCCNILLAQPGPPATPIDGGLSILMIIGGLLGLKKILGSKKEQ